MVHHISPFVSSRLLRRLSNSTVDRAEDVLSELWERGYLVVERDSWWKVEVLVAMITRVSTFIANLLSADISGRERSQRGGFRQSRDNIGERGPCA
jgi:hypothetical protein